MSEVVETADFSAPWPIKNAAYFVLGLGFIGFAWAKAILSGYSTPTQFDTSIAEWSNAHSASIARGWLARLEAFAGPKSWVGKDVLELGPGGSLGAGTLLLAEGARFYLAVDAFPLSKDTAAVYERLLAHHPQKSLALEAVADPTRFGVSVSRRFEIDQTVDGRRFDIIVSTAAFEHFDDIADTMRHMTRVCRPGAYAASRSIFRPTRDGYESTIRTTSIATPTGSIGRSSSRANPIGIERTTISPCSRRTFGRISLSPRRGPWTHAMAQARLGAWTASSNAKARR